MSDFKFVSAHIDDYFKIQNLRVSTSGLTIELVDGDHWKVVSYEKDDYRVLEIVRKLIYSHPQADADIYHNDAGEIMFKPHSGWKNQEGADVTTYEYLTGPHVSVIFRDALVKKLKS